MSAWAVMLAVLLFLANIMHQLSGAVKSLGGQMQAVKRYSIMIETSLNALTRDVKENRIHLQAHSSRMDIIEKRMRELDKKKHGTAPLKSGERIVVREYIIQEAQPQKPSKNETERPKKNP